MRGSCSRGGQHSPSLARPPTVEVTDKVDRKSDDKEDTQKVYNCNKTKLKKRNSYLKM